MCDHWENFGSDAADLLGAGPLVFFVPGVPRPQPRPRLVKSGNVISTLDKNAARWRAQVRKHVLDAMKNRAGVERACLVRPLDGALRVDMRFCFPTKETSRHGKHHLQVPDKDNLEKLVLDSMEAAGIFAKSDSQVAEGETSKFWGSEVESGVFVKISRPIEVP